MFLEIIIKIINILWIITSCLSVYLLTIKIIKHYQQGHYHFLSFKDFFINFSMKHWYFHSLIIWVWFIDWWYAQLLYLFCLGMIFLFLDEREMISKLKFTKRIIRLIIMIIFLTCGLLVLMMLLSLSIYKALTVIFYVNIMIIFISALIMNIIEKGISHRYHIMASKKIKEHKPIIIGITGSCGKTSVKNYVYELLSKDYVIEKSDLSYNTINGLSMTINSKLKNHCVMVLEMGASHKGDISDIVKYFPPDYAFITEILPQHLTTFKTMDNLTNEKMQIVYGLKNGGVVFANYDNEIIRSNIEKIKEEKNIKIVSYGLKSDFDVYAEDITLGMEGSSFNVCYGDNKLLLKTKLLGRHNVSNILASVALCLHLQVHNNTIIDKVASLEPVKHRLSIRHDDILTILDDSYNSNQQGFMNALEILSTNQKTKVIITPGIVEAGNKSLEINQKMALEIIKTVDIAIIVDNKMSQYYIDVFKEANFRNYYIVKSFKEAYEIVKNKPYVVLIENDLPDYYFL